MPGGLCTAIAHPHRHGRTTPSTGGELPGTEPYPDGGALAEAARDGPVGPGPGGDEASRLAPHLAMPGNRPNSVITMDSVNPGSLGALLALYEHRTFCSARLWGINPFDQWGVELGKEIGTDILGRLSGQTSAGAMDPSTERLMRAWRNAQS